VSSPGQVTPSGGGRMLMGPAMNWKTIDILDALMVERVELLDTEPKDPFGG
jgi:hypothetical protein